jgi:hypothetical protein
MSRFRWKLPPVPEITLPLNTLSNSLTTAIPKWQVCVNYYCMGDAGNRARHWNGGIIQKGRLQRMSPCFGRMREEGLRDPPTCLVRLVIEILMLRLSENAHLLRYPHPLSLRRTYMYASLLGISEALHLDIFHQPHRNRFFDSLAIN